MQSNPVRTRVKVCGITSPEDAVMVARAGADAIGLNFHPASPRAIEIGKARRICAVLPPFVNVVGLFVNATVEQVRAVLAEVPLDLLQFHGDESPDYCAGFGRPWMKALRMRPELDLAAEFDRFAGARCLLLDAWHKDSFGGTGQVFDWSRVGPELPRARIVLAGGLNPGNVAQAIRELRPWAVDVSSGVESAPGRKSAELVQRFISEVQRA